MGIHAQAAPIIAEAVKAILGRKGTAAERQYTQAIAFLETAYGRGWKGAMVGSNNWGAVQCAAGQSPCIAYQDSFPDGTPYSISFRAYESPEKGAEDVARHVLKLRPQTARALEERNPTTFRASYAMRREKYYGGFCPQATSRFGGAVANASFATPDRDAGTKACAEECISAHAKRVAQIVHDIAADTGEPAALSLGNYADADSWWHGGGSRSWAPLAGLVVAGLCVGGLAAGLRFYGDRA